MAANMRQRLGTLGARSLAGRCPQQFCEPQRTLRVLTPSEPNTRQRRRQAEPGVCIAAIETPAERDAQVVLSICSRAMSGGPRNAPCTPGCAKAVYHATCRLWRMRASPEVCGGLLHNAALGYDTRPSYAATPEVDGALSACSTTPSMSNLRRRRTFADVLGKIR